VGLKTK